MRALAICIQGDESRRGLAPRNLKETAATGVERARLIQIQERDVANLFADLTFEKRLSMIAEGFCPYCAVALRERVPFGSVVHSRCPCCSGQYRTLNGPKFGPGWYSIYGRDCAHTGAYFPDESKIRVRAEWRDRFWVNRAGRLVCFLRGAH
jgi:hypothetical protein